MLQSCLRTSSQHKKLHVHKNRTLIIAHSQSSMFIVSNRWTGFSTGMWIWKVGLDYSTGKWDWNVGLECGTGILRCHAHCTSLVPMFFHKSLCLIMIVWLHHGIFKKLRTWNVQKRGGLNCPWSKNRTAVALCVGRYPFITKTWDLSKFVITRYMSWFVIDRFADAFLWEADSRFVVVTGLHV